MKKKIIAFLLVFVVLSMFVGFSYVNAEVAADDAAPSIPDDAKEPIPAPWPEEPGAMPDLVGGRVPDRPRVYSEPSPDKVDEPAPLAINAWYGNFQNFGQIGNPQQWINILGNVTEVSASDSVTLTYSLNNGADLPLSIGANLTRLVEDGDFNVEIDYADLNLGSNKIVIKANDGSITDTQKIVTVDYTTGRTWPSDYVVDWSSTAKIQDAAQVVDGHWQIGGDSVYIDADNYGYDRLLAIGDETWNDYEVTVPVTVFGLDPAGNEGESNGSAIGMILHWQGHTQIADEQPRLDWKRTGAIGWYRWAPDTTEGLQLIGYDWRKGTNFNKVLEFDTTYVFKMAVQSVPDNPAWYYLKFWKASENEPKEWDIQGYSSNNASTSGSLLLVAHHVDANFGKVTVKDLEKLRLNVNVDIEGGGSIVFGPDPDQKDFGYADRVFVYALPEIGYEFDRWTGDYIGSGNPADFRIYADMNMTAHFKPKAPTKLVVKTEGLGSVTKDPNRTEYPWGEEVELTAVPAGDQIFLRWIGDVTGIKNPTSIIMDEDKEVTAVFGPKSEATPKSDDFSQCVLNTNLWSIVNTAGDGELTLTGTAAKFTVPAGTRHDMWGDNSDALRIMQPTENQNFEVEAKFENLPTERYQMQGILVQQDVDNWLRLDFHHDGSSLRANVSKNVDGNSSSIKSASVDPGNATKAYIRVERNGNKWTQYYSFNGNDWTTFALFLLNPDLEVASTGVFVGNASQTPGFEPAFTSNVDYFFNTAAPIEPEDQGNTVNVAVSGQGQVQVSPIKETYQCGEKVTLTATPANEWLFAGWSGDLSGRANPAILTIQGDYNIRANFSQGSTVFLPSVMGN